MYKSAARMMYSIMNRYGGMASGGDTTYMMWEVMNSFNIANKTLTSSEA
jgi:hypothetical protein